MRRSGSLTDAVVVSDGKPHSDVITWRHCRIAFVISAAEAEPVG